VSSTRSRPDVSELCDLVCARLAAQAPSGEARSA
jgi:hypothetical protein